MTVLVAIWLQYAITSLPGVIAIRPLACACGVERNGVEASTASLPLPPQAARRMAAAEAMRDMGEDEGVSHGDCVLVVLAGHGVSFGRLVDGAEGRDRQSP